MEMRKKLTDKGERDLKLINLALNTGDPKAYGELMKLYRDPLYFMIYEKIGDQDISKDLTIESLGKAFKKLHLYKPEFTFSTWLFTVARNHCIDFFVNHHIWFLYKIYHILFYFHRKLLVNIKKVCRNL